MITTAEQYNANLHLIHNTNPPTYVALPTPDQIYNIDASTREIDAPKFLGVEKDHVAETIYFIVDRFVDYMDLATTSCIITYINALGKTRLYTVPFYDIYSYAHANKIIIPWCLDANVTEAPGEIQFAIQFFKTEIAQDNSVIKYSLNTLPAKSKVLNGIALGTLDKGYRLGADQYEELVDMINVVSKSVQQPVTWTIMDI